MHPSPFEVFPSSHFSIPIGSGLKQFFSSSFWSWPSSKLLKPKGIGLFPKGICQIVWGDGLRAGTEKNEEDGWSSSCWPGCLQEGSIFIKVSDIEIAFCKRFLLWTPSTYFILKFSEIQNFSIINSLSIHIFNSFLSIFMFLEAYKSIFLEEPSSFIVMVTLPC